MSYERRDHNINTRITPHQADLLDQIRVKKKYQYQSDVVREAIEQYIQNEGNVIGSRRHFNRSMGALLQSLKEIILITFTWQLVLIAQGFTTLLRAMTGDEEKWQAMDLITESSKVAMSQYPKISQTVEDMRTANNATDGE